MKKSIFILSTAVASIGLTAFTFFDWSAETQCQVDPFVTNSIAEKNIVDITDLYFGFGSIYAPIPKGKVHSATTIKDLFSEEGWLPIVSVRSSKIIVIKDGKRTSQTETGITGTLSQNQIELLRSFDYTSEFIIKAEIVQKNNRTGRLENAQAGPHYSVVPEKQATNALGNEALVEFVKEYAGARLPLIDQNKLRPSKIIFTVEKNGSLSNIKLDRTSGYPSFDGIMLELMSKLPGNWIPAEDTKGNKVKQILAFTFGTGC